ncbi:hypothetical protein HT574_19105 [Parageobacillus sp. VR-IP]|uniref:DUF6445 family protein n=1 Tax=Parageobacillus sp. VR-IP TaxID=2742205 RepID=UPI00158156BD|nr:DUF6445 family protein [Parageobacillus sp. VR-IP]NUK32086.1 hypothetical protein [Parageobacillus sp. VR-IP]
MEKDFIVIDDFYENPDKVRNFAINVKDWIDIDINGKKKYSVETVKCYYNQDIIQKFEEILGFKIEVNPKKMGFGVFAYYPGESNVQLTTHYDDCEWSGIIYLVPDEFCEGGLSLYRHKKTKLLGPPDDKQLKQLGFSSFEEWKEIYHRDKLNPNAWEETLHISMKYNRLILLRSGKLFHRATSGFGNNPKNARLTQRFFFNKKEGKKEGVSI